MDFLHSVLTRFFHIWHSSRQRLVALFLVLLLVLSSSAQTTLVLAATPNNHQLSNSAAAQSHQTSTTPSVGTINPKSPPVLPTVQATNPVATDVTASSAHSDDSFVDGVSGKINNESITNPVTSKPNFQPHELTDKRTATSSTFQNKDGSLTRTNYFSPRFYEDNTNTWQSIDTSLVPDDNAADSGNVFGKALGKVESWFSSTTTFMVKANDWQARFAPSDFNGGMVRIRQGNEQFVLFL